MIKKRHFNIVIGILLVGIVLGSFFDLQINQALFSKNNLFGLLMASFGTYPCYAGFAFIGGGLLATTWKRNDLPWFAKIIAYVLSALGYVLGVILCAKDFPSINGFNNDALKIPSYIGCAVLFAGVYYLAFRVCSKGDKKALWSALLVMPVVVIVGLLPVGWVVKQIIHRPRYRFFVREGVTDFYNWWQSCTGYKDFIKGDTVIDGITMTKEEFKSFPSGHSGTAAVMMMFLPYYSMFFKKLKGKETLLFYIGFAWTLLMMFSRMLVGAHFLSDTCTGSLIVMVVFYVVHVFSYSKGWVFKKEEEPQAEAEPAQ